MHFRKDLTSVTTPVKIRITFPRTSKNKLKNFILKSSLNNLIRLTRRIVTMTKSLDEMMILKN